jgi:hypothetical protein
MRVLCALAFLQRVSADVKSKVITVTGAACGSPEYSNLAGTKTTYQATVFYPSDDTKTYPVLSFAHGATNTDPRHGYNGILDGVASAGYIIIALNDCPLSMSEWKPQVSSLVYMLTQEQTLKKIIDFNASTGVFGHSMGGQATICSASDADSVKQARIAAAVSMHPGFQIGPSKPIVPILYFAGQVDHIVPSAWVKSKYEQCPHNVDRGYAVFSGYSHFIPNNKSDHEVEWIGAMMDCYIKKNNGACIKVYGDSTGQGGLCNAGQTSYCETHLADKGTVTSSLIV